ncbi:hypothetical protein RJT34_09108 [Clitoria ternatea]|uniref:Uncharacterized protein n=1 Tax=Clitoria ternatea TaxID=43366 RepID=A0AAN9K7E4_CLITE
MSDIAMLVAEEYERRVKNFKKGGAVREGELNMVSSSTSLLVLTRRLKEKELVIEWDWEPKTQFAIAASNSFFSA